MGILSRVEAMVARGYDLMVNTGSMDGESTARAVVAALLRRVPTAARSCG